MSLDDAKALLARVEKMKADGKTLDHFIAAMREDVSSLAYSTAMSQISGRPSLDLGPSSATLPAGRLSVPGRI